MLKHIVFGAVLLYLFSILVDVALRREFKVHTKGIIVISGCSTGIGRHAAFYLAKHGFTVFTGVRKQAQINELLQESRDVGVDGKIVPVILDVRKDNDIDDVYNQVLSYSNLHSLPLVGVINNAAVLLVSPIETSPRVPSQDLFDVNYWGTVALTQKFLAKLREDKGRVIFVTSTGGKIAQYGLGIYSASKFAVEAMADALRVEVMEWGISVSVIEPGTINTTMASKTLVASPESFGITEEQQKIYESFWEANSFKQYTLGDPDMISEVFLDAIINPYPKTRYAVGPAGGGLDAPGAILLSKFLPDRVFDHTKIMFLFPPDWLKKIMNLGK